MVDSEDIIDLIMEKDAVPGGSHCGGLRAPAHSDVHIRGFHRFSSDSLLLAVLTAAVGLVLIFRPTESRETMTVLLGLSLLAEGGLNLAVALSTVKIVKNQYPDVIEGEFTEKERDAR